ncbi:MAG: energy transducer TonB [Gammaproteobacteria bacterium]|nr:energy transducer TonB [Gammaproteobacteria bacterium]
MTAQHRVPMITRDRFFPATVFASIILVFCSNQVFAQASGDLQTLIRQASKECRAAKTLRRSDLGAAKDHFRQYRQLINQARSIKPDLLDAPDTATERVLNFCFNVKRDLDRAEALPLFEQGLRECAEARIMISNAAFDDAEAKYRVYREQKEGALAISDSVLDVYENSYEVRLCDRLGDDIAQAKADYQRQLHETAGEAQNVFADVVKSLRQSDRQCRGAQNLVNDVDSYNSQTVTQITNLSKEANKVRVAALAQRDALLTQGKPIDAATEQRIEALVTGINECEGSIPAAIKRVQATLAARTASGGSESSKGEAANREYRQIVGAPANYPRRAIQRNIEGEVVAQFTITKTGDVTDIEIISENPEGWFDKAVTEAVSKYKFQPRMRNGQPVDAKGIQRKIVFKLR